MTLPHRIPKINSYVCIFKGVLVVCIIRIEISPAIQPIIICSKRSDIFYCLKTAAQQCVINEAAVNTGLSASGI